MLASIGVVVAAALLVLLVLVVLTLVLPFRIAAQVDTQGDPAFFVRVQPFGRYAPWLSIPAGSDKEKDESRPAKRRSRSPAPVGRMVRAAPALVTELLSAFRVDRLWAVVDLGLENPDDTGTLFGYLAPLTYGTIPALGGTLVLRPDFDGQRFDAEGLAAVRVVPVTLVPPLARFAWRIWRP